MNRDLRERLLRMVAEEQRSPVDHEMLAALKGLMVRPDDNCLDFVRNMGPEQRNALNIFLREIRDFMISETMRGEYGAAIIADSTIVMAFESGVRAERCKLFEEGGTEGPPPEGTYE